MGKVLVKKLGQHCIVREKGICKPIKLTSFRGGGEIIDCSARMHNFYLF